MLPDSLSILIPVYNCSAWALVQSLVRQEGLRRLRTWEIIVADDASTDAATITENQQVATLPHCRYLRHPHNVGRAANRNSLVAAAVCERLIFIDGDMCVVSPHFIELYLDTASSVIYGGYTLVGHHPHNLRYLYERSAVSFLHTVEQRKSHPNLDFHTSNYSILRALALRHPLDESYQGYGYEDVAYGAQLQEAGIQIDHIDNPVGFHDFEPNEVFISKTEESLRILVAHASELAGYSRIVSHAARLRCVGLHYPLVWLHRHVGKRWRIYLAAHPSLLSFKFYKLAYYLRLLQAED